MATTFRNQNLFCLNCGGSFKIEYPIEISEMTKKITAFDELHKDCKKTWSEPTFNQSEGLTKRAMQWKEHGETGASSNAMWHCLMEDSNFIICHPWDPDDFGRCYKLLQAVPEWKNELHKLKSLSLVWSRLVDNWDVLTEMYEKNVANDWKTHKEIGMYEFMKAIINC